MKKVLKLAITLAMVLALAVNAFAAGSVVDNDGEVDVAVDSDVTVSAVPEAVTDEEALDSFESAVADLGEAESTYLYDVTLDDGEIPEDGLKLTFTVPDDVGDDEQVVVLHYEDGEWVVVGRGEAGSPTAVGTFYSLSPVGVAVVKIKTATTPSDDNNTDEPTDEPTDAPTTGDNGSSNNGSTGSGSSNNSSSDNSGSSNSGNGNSSPKTGEQDFVLLMGTVALLAGGAACVSYRKKAE